MPTFTLTPAAKQLILDYEVGGGEKWYDKFAIHPEWPGFSSGVTIGVGYDIGQSSASEFQADWGNRLTPSVFNRLKACVGIHGAAAKPLIAGLKDISIPWSAASAVFFAIDVPKYYRQTQQAFPGVESLPLDAQGALLSLIFNRGPGMKGDGRREMRAIRELVPKDDLKGIAAQLRSMERLWPSKPGKPKTQLARRRDAEAKLLENAKGEPLTAPNNDASQCLDPRTLGAPPLPQTLLA